MFITPAVPMLRRATYAVLPMLLVLGMTTATCAVAQSGLGQSELAQAKSDTESVASSEAPSFNSFSSSADALSAAANDLVAAPAVGGEHARGTYGHRDSGPLGRWTIEAGGGANAPTSDSSDYITWGGNFTGGVGYRMHPHLSLLAEYQFIDDKLPGRIISETGAQGGHAHIWSFTLAPVIDLFPRRTNDIYITGGGGFYRKVTSFTDPVAVQYCNYYYCGITTENQVVGHFSSNQGGWNVGAGFTHRLGDGKAKLFAEARYLNVDTPAVTSEPNGLGTTTVAAGTKLVPVTFGVRF